MAVTASQNLLAGAIDFHAHSAPDLVPRAADDLELVQAARAAGMGGLVLKSHVFQTVDRAWWVGRHTGFPVFSGVTLNQFSGGINPYAVRAALDLGGKVVWMPTAHARQHQQHHQSFSLMNKLGVAAADALFLDPADAGQQARLRAIWQMVADHGAILATGHLSGPEIEYLFSLRPTPDCRFLLTHALSRINALAFDEIAGLAHRPNVFVELCAVDLSDIFENPRTLDEVLQVLDRVPRDRVVLASDAGQIGRPLPPAALGKFLENLLAAGVPAGQLHQAAALNPKTLLGLN